MLRLLSSPLPLLLLTIASLASVLASADNGICVGYRGNANYLYTHLGATAKIVETLGPIDIVSGGSSGTASTLMVESVQSNPLVVVNGAKHPARISFLIKSIEYIATDGFGGLIDLGMFLEFSAQLLFQTVILDVDDPDSVEAFIAFLETWEQTGVNPEFIELLKTSFQTTGDPRPFILDAARFISFDSISNDTIGGFFVRPRLVNWDIFGKSVDVYGSYLIGYEPVDLVEMEHMLEQCAFPSLGKEWPDVSKIQVVDSSGTNTTTCGQLMEDSFKKYLQAREQNYTESNPPRSRLMDPIGNEHQISIGLTAGLSGDNIRQEFDQARMEYSGGNLQPPLNVDFASNVSFGYWANATLLELIEANLKVYHDDLKSNIYHSLAESNWLFALQRSPAEPGFSRAIETEPNFLSIGGWSDPFPMQVLNSTGMCQTILLVAHPDTINLGYDVAEFLGANTDELNSLFDRIGLPDSSWNQALDLADATFCVNITDVPDTDIRRQFSISWNAPLTGIDEDSNDAVSLFPADENPPAALPFCTPLLVTGNENVPSSSPITKSPITTRPTSKSGKNTKNSKKKRDKKKKKSYSGKSESSKSGKGKKSVKNG